MPKKQKFKPMDLSAAAAKPPLAPAAEPAGAVPPPAADIPAAAGGGVGMSRSGSSSSLKKSGSNNSLTALENEGLSEGLTQRCLPSPLLPQSRPGPALPLPCFLSCICAFGSPVRTATTHCVIFFYYCDPFACLGQLHGSTFTTRTCTDNDGIKLIVGFSCFLFGCHNCALFNLR